MIRLIYLALMATCWMANAQNYIDASGREWMRIDSTFAFAPSLASQCNPDCSGVVTQFDYNIRLNSFTNPRSVSLSGWRWASKDEAQLLMDSVDLLSLGTSQQFVTTYSYSASVYASTSTVDPVSNERYIAYSSFGHNMVSVSFGSGFLLGISQIWSGAKIGALIYRSPNQPKNCAYNGKEILNGDTVLAFSAAKVAYNQSCQSEVRTCTDGVLSGSFTATSCQVTPALNCSYNGQTILHGQSISGYLNPTATSLGTYGTFCSKYKTTSTCTNGSIQNLYPSCTQTVLDPNRCRIKDGAIKCKT